MVFVLQNAKATTMFTDTQWKMITAFRPALVSNQNLAKPIVIDNHSNLTEQFMFDRTKQSEMAAFIKDKDGIVEEDEDAEEPLEQSLSPQTRPQLNDIDEARLQSCLDEIRNVIGDSIPERILVSTIVRNGFDIHRSLDAVLNTSTPKGLLLQFYTN
jgi:HBS1 N-terminus